MSVQSLVLPPLTSPSPLLNFPLAFSSSSSPLASADEAPSDLDPDLSWLDDFEPPRFYADEHKPALSGNVTNKAQLSQRLSGRLRKPEFMRTWRRYTRDPFLLKVLHTGLELPLTNGIWPSRHECSGNHIKREHAPWARSAIAELVSMGSVSRWDDFVAEGLGQGSRPHMVMPLIVTPKPNKTDAFRLCHDARILNALLDKKKFKMSKLEDFCKQLVPEDRLFSLDIESAYHHVEVNTRFCTLLGFEFEGVFYVYRCLPFGLVTSAQVFCALTEVTADAVRESGLVTALIAYVDDFGGSIGKKLDHKRMADILALIRSFGWVLAPSKLIITLERRLQLLGFVLDTREMTISVPEVRRVRLLASAAHVLKHRRAVSAREVCKLIGQILSMRLALGLVCRLRSRYLMLAVKPAAISGKYNKNTVVAGRALDELLLWNEDVTSLAASPMQPHLRPVDYVMEADASDHALGAIVVKTPVERADLNGLKIYRRLLPHEALWGSLLREMTGYRDAVHTLAQTAPLAGTVVEVVGDAQSATFIFANGGSQVQDASTGELLLLEVLLDILALGDSEGCEIRFRWVPREQLQDADDLSKLVDRMDFSLKKAAFKYVLARFGPVDIDAFAAPHNAIAKRFYARHGAVSAEARDAFAQSWSSGVLYMLPDFHAIDKVLDKIECDNAIVIIIVPVWRHKSWWHRLWSGAWSHRLDSHEYMCGSALVPNNEHAFFGENFATDLLVLKTRQVL